VPYCYYPIGYDGYQIKDIKETKYGYQAMLERTSHSGWPSDIMKLLLDVYFDSRTRLHFKVSAQHLTQMAGFTYIGL